MTGRYLIYTPVASTPDERRFDRAWRRFAEVCRSLYQDGLTYGVQLNLGDRRPHILITASGKAKQRKIAGAHRVPLPPPIPAQRCRDRATEVEWFLPENRERRKDGTAYWARHQARYQELSVMVEEFLRAELEYWREWSCSAGSVSTSSQG